MFSRDEVENKKVIEIGQFYGKATRYFKEFENSPNRDIIIRGMLNTIMECVKANKPFSLMMDTKLFRVSSLGKEEKTIFNKLEDIVEGYEYLANQIYCNVTMKDIFVEPDDETAGFTLMFREKDNSQGIPEKVTNILQFNDMAARIKARNIKKRI